MRISDWSSDVCSSDLCSLYCTPLSCGRPSCSIRYVLLSSVMTYPLVTLLVHAHPIRSGDAKLAAAKDEYLRDRRVIDIAPNVQTSDERRVRKEGVRKWRSRWSE